MSFQKKVWRDYPNTSTPITAEELNRIEQGIDDVGFVTKWLRAGDSADDIRDAGNYPVTSVSVEGVPDALGHLIHHGGSYPVQFFTYRSGAARLLWRGLVGSSWTEWLPIQFRQSSLTSSDLLSDQNLPGYYTALSTIEDRPDGAGVGALLNMPLSSGSVQMYFNWFSPRVWVRSSTPGTNKEWTEITKNDPPVPVGGQKSTATRIVPQAITLPGITRTDTRSEGSVRWVRQTPNKGFRARLHVANRNPANDSRSGSVTLTGVTISRSDLSGAVEDSQEVPFVDMNLPSNGDDLISKWFRLPGVDGEPIAISLGWQSSSTQQLMQGGGWTTETSDSYSQPDTQEWTYTKETPFYVWLEVEMPTRIPVLLAFGDSTMVGTASDAPVQDSWPSYYSLEQNCHVTYLAQHGSKMTNWGRDSERWDNFYKDLPIEADAIVTGIGTNDLGTGITAQEAIDRYQTLLETLATRWPNVPIYIGGRTGSHRAPEVQQVRREFNDWLRTLPEGTRDFYDFGSLVNDLDDERIQPQYTDDGLHLNSEGNALVASMVVENPVTPYQMTETKMKSL